MDAREEFAPVAAVCPPPRVEVAGQELTIYTEAAPLLAAMLEDIRNARTRVWLEIYIILDDAAGQAIAAALTERARAGVDVRLLYDAVGSLSTPSAFFNDLEQAGVQVCVFHSLWEALWRFSFLRILNRRNHRKLLVIDDQIAYFGGMNIVHQSSDLKVEKAESLPASAGWRDIHVRLVGSRQGEIAESFDRSWKLAHGERLERRLRPYRQGLLAAGTESIQFFDSGPGLKYTRAALVFMRLLRAANRRLTFSMAYFVPVAGVLRELLRAHRRGVYVQVVVPGDSDVPIVHRATRYLYTTLLRRRFQLFERRRGMLHSKTMIVDDEWTVLGSANLDARSMWINLEFLAVIHSRPLARVMNEIVQHEIRQSERITLKSYLKKTTWWQRFIDRLAWEMRWWL